MAKVYEKCNLAATELVNYDEASKFEEWNVAIKEELAMIQTNKTWSLTARPKNKMSLGSNGCKTKFSPDCTIYKHKPDCLSRSIRNSQVLTLMTHLLLLLGMVEFYWRKFT